MKKVSVELQAEMVEAYLMGYTYKLIQYKFGVSRWNIQDALSKFGVKTNRIKSPPRLPGNKKVVPGRLMERYHDGDYLPPMKETSHNPVLQDDLDIMEKMDNRGDADTIPGGSISIVVDENDEVRYEKDV